MLRMHYFINPCPCVFLRIRSTAELSAPQTKCLVVTMRDLPRKYFADLWRLVVSLGWLRTSESNSTLSSLYWRRINNACTKYQGKFLSYRPCLEKYLALLAVYVFVSSELLANIPTCCRINWKHDFPNTWDRHMTYASPIDLMACGRERCSLRHIL